LAVWDQDEARFRELVLYISEQCAQQLNFGAVKLNKLLFYSDFLAYALLGRPITGLEYQRYNNGPVPREMQRIRQGMQERGEIRIDIIPLPDGRQQHRVVGLRESHTDVFSPRTEPRQ
jgi:hypothetical protein